MKRLRKFVVTPLDQRKMSPWPDWFEPIPYEGPNQRVFGYCFINWVSCIGEDCEQIFTSYMFGEDQKAYDKLMQIVCENAST